MTLVTEIVDPREHNGYMGTQLMSEEAVEASTQYLKKGLVVSIEGRAEGVTATVLILFQDKLFLELLRPSSPAFQVGDHVQVMHWEGQDPTTSRGDPVISRWDGRVSRVQGPAQRHLVVALLGEKVERLAVAKTEGRKFPLLALLGEKVERLALFKKEKRKFRRWTTSIPCTVKWPGHQINGKLVNISLGGALITEMSHAADSHSKVHLSIKAESVTIQLVCSVTSRVIRKSEEINGDKAAWVAVRFEEPLSRIRSKLGPLFSQLASEAQPK